MSTPNPMKDIQETNNEVGWEKEAAKTATEAIKLTKHYAEFSERIYQGFKKAALTTRNTALREAVEKIDNVKGFIITKSINGGEPEDYYVLSKDHVHSAIEALISK